MENIQRVPPGPALQSNMPNAPSGPRGNGRGPPSALPSPVSRGPPTGPAATDRGSRGGDRRNNPLGAINSVLTQNAPTPESKPSERTPLPPQNPPVRGRGSTRANGPAEVSGGTSSPMPPPQNNSTPNVRADAQHGRGGRDTQPSTPQDDGRLDTRGHRDNRRGERSGHDRVRSPDRGDRRPDERAARNGPPGEERGAERERGSGRDKRGSERDSSSRRERSEREGGSDRPTRESGGLREPREPREPRESGGSRRERGSRDDGGRPRDDRRSRGGGSADDGRKRARDPADQGQGHGDPKRRR
jgi:THO complex subunit 2